MKKELIHIKDIGNIDLFDTQYKIKFIGLACASKSKIYTFKTHDKIFGLEFFDNENFFCIRNQEEILKMQLFAAYKYNQELTIENKEMFKSNIFNIEKTPFNDYYININYEIYKEIYGNTGYLLNEKDFKDYLCEINEIENSEILKNFPFKINETLDDIIQKYNKYEREKLFKEERGR